MVYDVGRPMLVNHMECETEDNTNREQPNCQAREFYELLQNADEKLYPGCEESTLEAISPA